MAFTDGLGVISLGLVARRLRLLLSFEGLFT
jgi:hypothetical protein